MRWSSASAACCCWPSITASTIVIDEVRIAGVVDVAP
jgi:hypothetical protein